MLKQVGDSFNRLKEYRVASVLSDENAKLRAELEEKSKKLAELEEKIKAIEFWLASKPL